MSILAVLLLQIAANSHPDQTFGFCDSQNC